MNSDPLKKPPEPSPICGWLSIAILFGAFLFGIASTMSMADRHPGAAAFGAIAGIGYGFIASIPSCIFATVGLLRGEKPLWIAIVGLVLSFVPAVIGAMILAGLSSHK